MLGSKLSNLFLEQSTDLIWIIDSCFNLKYANKAYQNVMKQVSGKEKKLNENILVEGFGDGYIEKWKAYYDRGIKGEQFQIEEHFYNPHTQQVEYSEISFKPIADENGVIINLACQSRDITSFIKSNTEAEILLDASLDVICSIDEQGIFTKVSAACKDLWGYEKHELVGKPYIDLIIDEDLEKTNKAATEILSGKTVTSFENRYKRKDGGIAFNLWSVRYDPINKILFCVARDAREKIQKEELLIESEQRFKALVQEGADMISIIDAAGNYRYTSPTTTAILGITPEEFEGKSVFDFIHPDDIEKSAAYMQRISTESKVIVEPFRLRDGNNEWRWIETILTNMQDNPAVNGIVANSRDITAKKKEIQHLKILETVVTNAKDVILISEAEPFGEPGPRIVYVNEAFTKLTGYTKEEVIGKTPRILQGPNSNFKELDKLGEALRKWESYEATTINYKKSGEEFWINFTVIPVADEYGWYTHWFAIERDVTESKKLELSKDLTSKISSIFNVENDLSGALSKICNEVAAISQFSFCEIWLTDIQENFLELKAVHKKDKAANIFYENSKLDTAFEKGQGLPGKIWENNQSIVWEHNGQNQELLFRSSAAEKAGIKTVVGVPLNYHEQFIGVLQFGTQVTKNNVEWLINVILEIGSFLGAEILRKKTEIELTKIFEFAPDIIATCGFDGFFKTVNPFGCNLLGYTQKEFTSKPLTDFLHPADAEITAAQLENLASGSPIYNFKNRYFTKTGSIKTINWNFSPSVKDALIFCIGKDITEEVKIGNLLNDANQMSRIGGWEVDLIKQELHWSDMVYEIHETDKSVKLSIANAIEFYRKDFQSLVKSQMEYSITSGLGVDFEAIIVTANNNELWVRAMGKAEIVNGECIRLFGSLQDINERKIIEQQKNNLLTTLEKSLNEIYVFDAETLKFSYVNQGALINLGYSEQEIKDLTPLDLTPEFTTTTFNQLVNPLVTKEKEKIVFFSNHKRKNGTLYPVEIHLQLVKEGNNKKFLAVILDITNLKETEQLLDSASKLARVGSWEIVLQDNEEFKVFWSSMTREILEIDELFEPTIADGINLYKESSRTLIATAVYTALETGEGFDLELELVSNRGNNIWVRCIGDTQFENGKVTRIYGSFQDINTRKLAELNQLKLIDEKNDILESIGDAFYALDDDLNFTYMNSSCANLLGVAKEKIVGKNLLTEFPALKNTLFEKELRKVQETAEASKFEFYYAPFDAWFDESIYPTPTGISVYFVDTTNRKKAERDIKQANERFEKVTEATNDVIWDWDIVTGKFFRSNAIDTFLGVVTTKVMDKKDFWNDNFYPDDISNIKSSLQRALEDTNCNRWEEEYRILNNNNEVIFVIDRGLILRNKNGKAIRMVGAMTNITEQKKQEGKLIELNQSLNKQAIELKRSNEELEQFAFVASHDLQEPLRMITSFLDQLKRKYGDHLDEKALQYIYFATDGAKRMKQIILDLLLYSRANRPTEQNELINLNDIVSEYTQLRRKVIAEKKAIITFNSLPSIATYRAPITQIFHCLLDNALKYVDEDKAPSIEIDAQEKENDWQFAIKDNGIGIDSKFYDKIFIIFQRLQNRKEHDGTGIGLAIAKRSIEFLGGKIWVESEKEKGSTFHFTISKLNNLHNYG